jgi:hypothetical protein
MRSAALSAGCVLLSALFAAPEGLLLAQSTPVNWQRLTQAGDFAGALRLMDAARAEVAKPYGVALKGQLPERLSDLNASEFFDNSASIRIMLIQSYAKEGAEVRVDLSVPTVDIDQATFVREPAIKHIKEIVAGADRPTTEQMEYLLLQGFAAQIRRDSIFAERPQMLIYLSNGAALTVHAMTDMRLADFKKLLGELPLGKINAAISGEAKGP